MKLGLVQMDCTNRRDVPDRLAHIDELLGAATAAGARIALLPEMVIDQPERIPGPTTATLCAQARAHGCWVVCGLAERADDGLYNSSVLVSPAGELAGTYRKVHLFGSERKTFLRGTEPAVFDTEFGRVALTICYDLIFPEYIRALVLRGARLILNSTNWVTNAWQTSVGWNGGVVTGLVATRALENGVHVAMADRVGEAEGWTSLGHSCVASPSGNVVVQAGSTEEVTVANLSLDDERWTAWREIATYLPDRRVDLYERLIPRD